MIRLQFDCDSIAFNTRRCQSNQLNAKSIEHNWTQSNDCNSIAERNRNSIEYYPGFAVRLSNVIESIEYYGKFQFNWFDSEELTKTDRHNHGKFFQNINARGWVVQANSWRNCAIFFTLRKFNPIISDDRINPGDVNRSDRSRSKSIEVIGRINWSRLKWLSNQSKSIKA